MTGQLILPISMWLRICGTGSSACFEITSPPLWPSWRRQSSLAGNQWHLGNVNAWWTQCHALRVPLLSTNFVNGQWLLSVSNLVFSIRTQYIILFSEANLKILYYFATGISLNRCLPWANITKIDSSIIETTQNTMKTTALTYMQYSFPQGTSKLATHSFFTVL